MGIKNLNQFLKKQGVIETLDISVLRFKKIGIDVPMFMYKFKGVTDPSTKDWLQHFIHFIAFLRKYDIHPIFLFEGRSPPEKVPVQEERRMQRQKTAIKTEMIQRDLNLYIQTGTITPLLKEIWLKIQTKSKFLLKNKALLKANINVDIVKKELEHRKRFEIVISIEDIHNLKELLDIMGVSWIHSKGEAEADCVSLFYDNYIDYIVTEDTDVLAYFNPTNSAKELKVISNFNTKDLTFTQINKTKVLNSLKLSAESFRDFCIMCGTDYNKNVPKVGLQNAYKYILRSRCIENVPLDTSILNHKRIRKLFEVTANHSLSYFAKWCRTPGTDFEEKFNKFVDTYKLKNIDTGSILKALSEPDINF